MHELLPGISLNTRCERRLFLDQVAEIAMAAGEFDVKKAYESPGATMDVLYFTPRFPVPLEGLFGWFESRVDDRSRIRVEIARSCIALHRLTYQEYVDAAHLIFDRLVKSYNRKHKARLRLNVQPKEDLEPTLPPGARKVFAYFVRNANLTDLHPYDWQRFYAFAQYCHTRRVILGEESLFRILVRSGFNETNARHIAGVYGHLRDFLKAPKNSYWALNHMPD